MKNVIDELGNEQKYKGGYTGEMFKHLKRVKTELLSQHRIRMISTK